MVYYLIILALCIFKGLYIRSRFTINPDKVYRMAMTRLNTSAGILEVMGPPLTGTDLRAYVMSGGGLMLKRFRPSIRGKRCFLIFPIKGSERKGLVSVEVKKKKGKVCHSCPLIISWNYCIGSLSLACINLYHISCIVYTMSFNIKFYNYVEPRYIFWFHILEACDLLTHDWFLGKFIYGIW